MLLRLLQHAIGLSMLEAQFLSISLYALVSFVAGVQKLSPKGRIIGFGLAF